MSAPDPDDSLDSLDSGFPLDDLFADAAASVDAPAPLAGRRLGHYLLGDKLGEGGMGVVYRARDEAHARDVAVKVLISDRDKARRRFLREAKAMSRVSHPNVIQIHEIGESDDTPFIAMELVRGVTLARWLEQPRTREQILDLFCAVGRGLAAAHERGLVHRDFKPTNVMIDDDGRALVMDFGLARAWMPGVGATTQQGSVLHELMTTHGKVMGTPGYMAPEQFCGQDTDPRTDQFSFCVALWEALHGQRPFLAETMVDLACAVTTGDVTVPKDNDVPKQLRSVLLRGLAVEPAQRWASMAALIEALQRGAAGGPEPVASRPWRWIAVAGVAAVVAALVVVVALALRS